MIFSTIYQSATEFINYIFSDGFWSIKAMSFIAFVFLLTYDSCKEWITFSHVEYDYFKPEDIGNCKLNDKVKNQTETKSIKKEEKTETLQLYKMFNSKK